MNIISKLSSQVGDSTEKANSKVAIKCLENPDLLKDVAEGLKSGDIALIGDCTEVLTKVAEENAELVAPYAKYLIPLLDHKNTRVRWEATHAIALIATLVPRVVSKILPQLHRMSLSDESTIVRDYSAVAIGNYARAHKAAAKRALPILERILRAWNEKQAARVIKGLQNIVETDRSLSGKVLLLIKPFEKSTKGTVKKALKDLQKSLSGRD